MNIEVRYDIVYYFNMELLYIIFKIVNNKLLNYIIDLFLYFIMNIFILVF